MKDKMFIVEFSKWDFDDERSFSSFVTKDKELAEKYVEKANKMLVKWKRWYSRFEDEDGYFDIENKSIVGFYRKWDKLRDFNYFSLSEVELR